MFEGPAFFTGLHIAIAFLAVMENFFGLADKFDQQGYCTINQLTGSRMSVENLSNWLQIWKNTADLQVIIQYAEEDMVLVRDGKFTMEPADRVQVELEMDGDADYADDIYVQPISGTCQCQLSSLSIYSYLFSYLRLLNLYNGPQYDM